MKTSNLILPLYLLLISGCSNEDDSIQATCFQPENRQVVSVFEKAEGYVLAPDADCSNMYTLTGGPNSEERNVERLAPCNLQNEFKIDSLKIQYSGFLFETFENENICAQKFEITHIEIMNK